MVDPYLPEVRQRRDDYQASVAYAGTLKKVEVNLAPSTLGANDQETVRTAERRAAMAIE